MYEITKTSARNEFLIEFDVWECKNGEPDPFSAFVKEAARLSGGTLSVTDAFYGYKLAAEGFCARFQWNGLFTAKAEFFGAVDELSAQNILLRAAESLNRKKRDDNS